MTNVAELFGGKTGYNPGIQQGINTGVNSYYGGAENTAAKAHATIIGNMQSAQDLGEQQYAQEGLMNIVNRMHYINPYMADVVQSRGQAGMGTKEGMWAGMTSSPEMVREAQRMGMTVPQMNALMVKEGIDPRSYIENLRQKSIDQSNELNKWLNVTNQVSLNLGGGGSKSGTGSKVGTGNLKYPSYEESSKYVSDLMTDATRKGTNLLGLLDDQKELNEGEKAQVIAAYHPATTAVMNALNVDTNTARTLINNVLFTRKQEGSGLGIHLDPRTLLTDIPKLVDTVVQQNYGAFLNRLGRNGGGAATSVSSVIRQHQDPHVLEQYVRNGGPTPPPGVDTVFTQSVRETAGADGSLNGGAGWGTAPNNNVYANPRFEQLQPENLNLVQSQQLGEVTGYGKSRWRSDLPDASSIDYEGLLKIGHQRLAPALGEFRYDMYNNPDIVRLREEIKMGEDRIARIKLRQVDLNMGPSPKTYDIPANQENMAEIRRLENSIAERKHLLGQVMNNSFQRLLASAREDQALWSELQRIGIHETNIPSYLFDLVGAPQ